MVEEKRTTTKEEKIILIKNKFEQMKEISEERERERWERGGEK